MSNTCTHQLVVSNPTLTLQYMYAPHVAANYNYAHQRYTVSPPPPPSSSRTHLLRQLHVLPLQLLQGLPQAARLCHTLVQLTLVLTQGAVEALGYLGGEGGGRQRS